ncbi:MAG: hypothetical protein NDI80_06845 [Flavobacteriaceae bacterium]|nr:hypothetical protein [Flavobacteriaceae bacterium]
MKNKGRSRAQESSAAIEKMYITMRHLFSRGFYKPMGVSGDSLRESLLLLRPEIYGSIAEEKVELNGLIYVLERLPDGIEECQFINLTADEGFSKSNFKVMIPPKRRRNCYRIDKNQMNIEITRGRSDIYDILTHLTFLFIESHKIMQKVISNDGNESIREWKSLEEIVVNNKKLTQEEREITIAHLGSILGRTYDETLEAYNAFHTTTYPDRFFHIIYWLGFLAMREVYHNEKRSINFSTILREEIGHHIYGEIWANNIKKMLDEHQLLNRPIHIVSANMHSVMNSIYAPMILNKNLDDDGRMNLFLKLSASENEAMRKEVQKFASQNGLIFIKEPSGTQIDVQLIDTAKIDFSKTKYNLNTTDIVKEMPVIIVMDYAFGEQAFETMDELLKPYYTKDKNTQYLNVESVSIMGKAGILEGGKGDIMIPTAHIFEGTADNYPFKNQLKKKHLQGYGLEVYEGPMVSVLGTSLQNKDILKFFHNSTWNVIGIEMEGAHYQKAIQSASKIRGNVSSKVKVRYAYYASDNPLETGSTLASGGLGTAGVKPTYIITERILEQIFEQ